MRARLMGVLLAPALLVGAALQQAQDPAIVKSEFIYTDPLPTPQAHASTIVETPTGLVAAWFGGEHERHPLVQIFVSRQEGGRWTNPVAVADGKQANGPQLPTWNPVLFLPRNGPLTLYYKVGPSPSTWWGMVMTSPDNGRTWSAPQRLPEGVLGPIRAKPIQLADGTLVAGSSSEHDGWRLHFELSRDGGRTWIVTGPMHDPKTIGAIQPTILQHRDGRLQAIGRTQQNRVFTTESSDGGRRWTPLSLTDLPNPSSGIDAVTLRDGRHLLVYNHTVREEPGSGRGKLHVAVSSDGKQWQAATLLEDEPTGLHSGFSYPAAIQTADGLVHITYTWKRRNVRHVVLDPTKLTLRPIVKGQWPS